WFVDLHLDYLLDLSRYFRVHVLLPLSRSVANSPPSKCRVLPVPSLHDAQAATLRNLVQHLVIKHVPDLRDAGTTVRQEARDEVCELILSGSPASRTEIEDILEYCVETFDPELHSSVLELAKQIVPGVAARRPPEPSPILGRETLALQFDSAL